VHYRCNQVYVPWVNKGGRKTDTLRNIVTRQETLIFGNFDTLLQVPVIQFSVEAAATKSLVVPVNEGGLAPPGVPKLRQHPTLSIIPESISNWAGSSDTPLKYMVSPRPMFCTGRCREEFEGRADLRADVISISATKDDQLSWEDPHGASMTDALIKVLRKDPHASLKHIMTTISHEMHTLYMELHDMSRNYKGKVKETNLARKNKGKGPLKRRTVEMDNFQDPQISSHFPLDMDRSWPL